MALSPEPGQIVLFTLIVLSIFIVSGIVQTVWLRTKLFRRLAWPLDGGFMLAGAPIFGSNKTFGGVLVLPPLVAGGFLMSGWFLSRMDVSPLKRGDSAASLHDWLLIGVVIAAGYVAGELVNSFIKRRCGLPPGGHPRRQPWNAVTRVVDQIDSVVVALVGLAFLVTLPVTFTLTILILGAVVHQAFNIVLKRVGLKKEAR